MGGGQIFRTRPDRPWGPPTSYTIGTGSFWVVKQPRRGVDHPLGLHGTDESIRDQGGDGCVF